MADADQSWSYGRLLRAAGSIARRLRSDYKVGRGDFCGVLCERGPDLVAALLGVNASGAAYVPLDAVYPTSRLEAMLEDSRAKVCYWKRRPDVHENPLHAGAAPRNHSFRRFRTCVG